MLVSLHHGGTMLERIGNFEIEEELGRGGFGRVYRAYDPRVGRRVAIKVVTTETDPDLVARFRREASLTANLHHENIVTVHEFGESEGRPYLVMELLEGKTLHRAMENAASFELLEKVRILCEVAKGLAHAHVRGVIHRDVKPSNVMILPDGRVKIMDFGIARVTSSHSTRRTREGFLLGTPLYMAPEQLQSSREADTLTDVFAFGVVCYEFLSGVHPFRANDPGALMYRILYEEPAPLHELMPDVPELLDRVVLRALAKDRDLRYQNLDDLRLDLEPLYQQERRVKAARIMDEIRPRLENADDPVIQTALRTAVDLDPSNAEAREARERIQKRAVRARVSALVQEANTHLRERRFREAVQALETAARTDRADASIQAQLGAAKSALESSNRASRLLAESRLRAGRGDFETALQNVTESLALDSSNASAQRWRTELESRIQAAEKEHELHHALEEAETLCRAQRYQEARDVLSRLAVRDARAEELARRIGAEEAAHARQERARRFSAVCEQASKAIDSGQWKAAARILESARKDFSAPDESATVAALEARARELGETRLAETARAIEELVRAARFDDAELLTRSSLAAFNQHPTLERLLEALPAERARYEHEQRLSLLFEDIAKARAGGRLELALEQARAGARQFPDDDRFPTLVGQLESEHAKALYDAGLAGAVASGRALLASGRFAEALAQLNSAAFRYPGASELNELFEQAQRAHAVEQAEAEARALLRDGKPEEAVPVLRGVLERQPAAGTLRSLLAEAEQQVAAARVRRHVEGIRAEVAELVARGQYDRAIRELEIGLEAHPAEVSLIKELDKVRAEARAREADTALQRSRGLSEAGDLDGAVAVLRSALEKSPGHPELEARLRSAKKKAEIVRREGERAAFAEAEKLARELGDRIRECLDEGDLVQARELLVSSNPAIRDIEPLVSLQARCESEERCRAQFRDTAALIANRKLRQARRRIEELSQEQPGRGEIVELRRLLEEAEGAEAGARVLGLPRWVLPAGAGLLIAGVALAVWLWPSRPPTISAVPSSIEWRYDLDNPAALTGQIDIASSGKNVSFRVKSDVPWILVEPAAASTPRKITLTGDGHGIKPGSYTGYITIESSGNPARVLVKLEVVAPPPVVIPPKPPEPPVEAPLAVDVPVRVLEFQSQLGSLPAITKSILIRSSKPAPLTVKVESIGGWLSASTAAPQTPAEVKVEVNPARLAPGVYTGTLRIAAGERQEAWKPVGVTLKILEPPLPARRPVLTLAEYRGRMKGEVRWSGSLADSEILIVQGGKAAPGTISGDLPNVPITTTLSLSGVGVLEAPSENNNWDRMVVRNQTGRPLSGLTIQWVVAK